MPADKMAHFVVGAGIAAMASALTGSALVGVGAAVFAGVLKEAYDATGRGTVDLWDFVATAIGGAVAVTVWGLV